LYKNNREDIYDEGIDYSYVALISSKIRIGIVGAGKAGTIKTKHFVKNKSYVEVLAHNFEEELIKLSKISDGRLKLRNEEFSLEFLRDKHLIIIALDDNKIKEAIKKYCDENYKIYIDSSNFQDGMGVVPAQRTTKHMMFALNTKGANPKGAVLVCNKAKELLDEYDQFIGFTTNLRNKAKELPEYKESIIKFIGSEEFKSFYDEGKSEEMLRINFPKDIVEYLLK